MIPRCGGSSDSWKDLGIYRAPLLRLTGAGMSWCKPKVLFSIHVQWFSDGWWAHGALT